MGLPSITRQIVLCFQALERFGESRHQAKLAGTARKWISSRGTEKTYLPQSVRFGRWVKREFGVRRVVELRPWMGVEYLLHLVEEGKSASTVKTTASALRKLSHGIEAYFRRRVEVLPDEIETPSRSLDDRLRAHIYSEKEAEMILAQLSGEAAQVVQVQILTGLRISEALSLRPCMVDLAAGSVTVKGKGGRLRTVLLDRPGAVEFFERLLEGVPEDQKLFRVSARTVQARVHAACQHLGIICGGTHGFRRLYAFSVLRDLLSAGLDERAAKGEVSRRLGHNRLGVISHYLPRPPVTL